MDGSFDVYKSKRYSEEAKWICIYPLYLNARKTIAHGRRISKEKAVDSPTSQEVFDVLSNAGFKVKLEKHAMHPLDPNRDTNAQGRVRVQLRNDDGTPFNEKFPTSLLLFSFLLFQVSSFFSLELLFST
ncbi:unnamed protein product [Toxocara canis]|uniref:Signal recognition particle 19 kDa protein n=1 Tax=Toxocara canis TaxID=6265 RepID=A0A183UCR2_TOXCA|nr:unnamed protein product [Toxocara canis]